LVHALFVAQHSAVRVTSWIFVLCAALGIVGAFLPSVELELRGTAVSERTQLSLYEASSNRERVRELIAAYHRSTRRELGGDVLRAASQRTAGRLRGAIDGARDAMETLDYVSEDDVRTAGTIFTVTLWSLLGLEALIVLLVFPQLMRGSYRRARLVAALATAVVVAAIAIALHAACREAVAQANAEVGGTTLALAAGAYVIPLAAVAALVAAVVLIVRSRRAAS
jgi:hypothetical protein